MVRCSKKARVVAAARPGLLKKQNICECGQCGRGGATIRLAPDNSVSVDRFNPDTPLSGASPLPQGIYAVCKVLPAAHDRDVILGPAAVRHELASFSLRGFPEGDLVELVEAVGLAPFGAQQFTFLTGRRHRRQ